VFMSSNRPLSSCFTLALMALGLSTASTLTQAQSSRPDLEGIWTNASLTNLTRPRGVDKLVVTEEEAALIVANTSIAGLPAGEVNAPEASVPGTAPPSGSFDFGLRGYNEFWIDPGSTLAKVKGEYRSSYIIDPP